MVTRQTILEALRPVMDPETGTSVVDLGMIRELTIDDDSVEIKMDRRRLEVRSWMHYS
jgi:metal-sulfur cluster biosynthetic enzyme